jgi:hypothetical protein
MSTQVNPDVDAKQTATPLFDRTFRDSQGNIVIAQPPNLPVSIGIAATLLQLVLPSGKLQTGVALIAFGTLFTWAWQEVFEGVNYFRRALGLIGLVGLMTLWLMGA